MSQHPLLSPGPAATVVVPRSPSRPSDPDPLSRDQIFPVTKDAGRSESSDSSFRERSSSSCMVLRLSSLTICPLQPLHRKADSIASSNVTRTFKHSLHMKKL